jgi:hypothetical protein
MMAAGIAMVVTGAGAASLLWPAGSGVAMICALLSAHLVTPGVEALRRPGTAPDA